MSLFNNQWPCKLKAEVKRFWDLTGSVPTIALAWLASVMLTFFRSDCTFRPHLSACHIGHIYLSKWWGMITDHRFWLCAAWSLDHTVPSSFFRTYGNCSVQLTIHHANAPGGARRWLSHIIKHPLPPNAYRWFSASSSWVDNWSGGVAGGDLSHVT